MNDNKLFNEFPPVTTEQWEAVIEKDLKGADYNKKLIWKTNEGFDVKPYYRANDIENLDYLQNNPSQEPFVRGYKAKDNCWDVRQDFESEDLVYQNSMMLQALERGANSIGVNATKIEKQEDFNLLFKDVKVDIIKVNFLKSKNFLSLLKMYCDFLKQNNINTLEVEGSINFDIFAYALKHGGYYNSLSSDLQELVDILKFAKENLPKFKVINVNAVIFKDAGSNITQELGFALALANEYVALLTDKGFALSDITSRLMFSFATGSDYFLEIAKLRSARLLWSNIIEQYEGATESDAKSYIHSENTLYNKTIFDAHVNLLRTTTETMSSVIAGADSISVKPFDVALKDSDEFSLRLALNQQILLKEESYLDKIVDPSSGSYYIETLTNNICEKAWEIFKQIEAMGGYAKAIENNFVQDKIEEMFNLVAKDMAKRKKVLVGTNQYPNLMEKEINYQKRDSQNKADKNTFKSLTFNREALPFEKLRLDVISSKKVPTIFLLLYGNLSMRTARAGFASNFFGVAGYEIANNRGYDTIDEAAEAILKANNDILVLCSSDDEYPELVKALLPKIKGKIRHIIVAGNPADEIKQEFDKEGVTDYINVRTNALESLTKYNKDLLN